jgi:soluble lytic murein transglycosylase-like protein
MECAASRLSPLQLAGAMLGLVAGVAPATALADVLEIGANGPVWVARAAGAAAPVQPSQGALPSAPLTEVTPEAGPAAWRARIGGLAAKYDLSPALLEALVWQESRWNPAAVSPAGARGLAQLMPGTARELGVDPDDPHANLEGGARYLRRQLDAFGGDLEKALAAYNAGPGRVLKAGGIPAIRETQLYVAAILGRLADPVRR